MSESTPIAAVISIGAMARNDLWNETKPVRTAHATTTLITAGAHLIIVDPGLPAVALEQRLAERAGKSAADITDVFLTSWRPAHRRALALFPNARWFMSDTEIATARQLFTVTLANIGSEPDAASELISQDQALLNRFTPAPDKIAPGVDLFPLGGCTPGQAGLIVSQPTTTLVVAGGAVATLEHFLRGKVTPDCYDIKQALGSLAEIYEIADVIIPGYDNQFVNPRSLAAGAGTLGEIEGMGLDL